MNTSKKRSTSLLRVFQNDRGSILLMSYVVIVVLLGLGAAIMITSANEARVSEIQRLNTVALHIAEAGLEKAFMI